LDSLKFLEKVNKPSKEKLKGKMVNYGWAKKSTKKLLVLDLDETLIHSKYSEPKHPENYKKIEIKFPKNPKKLKVKDQKSNSKGMGQHPSPRCRVPQIVNQVLQHSRF
jgi:predicted HAD superfamily phosphohydrolase YqeG